MDTVAQQRFASWMADVLVYIIVLNLFVEYVDAVVIDSFTISILTAVLLKAVLDALLGLEHRVRHFFSARGGAVNRAIGAVLVFAILFTGKLLILELVDIVFRGHVELGHFIEIVLLIIAMMAARALMAWIYERLGDTSRFKPLVEEQ